MTATIIKVTGADYSATGLGYMPAIPNGLEGLFLLGGTLTNSLKNYAPGKADLTVVGAPVVSSDKLGLTGYTNYLRTSISDSVNITFFVITDTSDTLVNPHTAIPYANYNGTTGGGVMLWSIVASGSLAAPQGRWQAYGQWDNSGTITLVSSQTANIDMSTKRLLCVTIANGVGSTIEDLTAGTVYTATTTLPRKLNPNTFLIGSTATSGLTGTCDVSALAHYSRVLASSEKLQVAASIRALASAKLGITGI